jgi:hypothetical protein
MKFSLDEDKIPSHPQTIFMETFSSICTGKNFPSSDPQTGQIKLTSLSLCLVGEKKGGEKEKYGNQYMNLD